VHDERIPRLGLRRNPAARRQRLRAVALRGFEGAHELTVLRECDERPENGDEHRGG
jgi:hypothetical protein